MEGLNLIKKHIREYKPISKFPGITPLKKLEDIQLENILVLITKLKNQDKNGSPPRIKIIIPYKKDYVGNKTQIKGIIYSPNYNFTNGQINFSEEEEGIELISEPCSIDNNYLKKEWFKVY